MPWGWAAAAVSAYSAYENGQNQSDAIDGANAANDSANQLSREQLAWEKEKYAADQPYREAAEKRAQEVSDASLASMNYAMSQAKDAEEYNKTTFRPLEQKLVADAQNYDTEERRNQEAGAAVNEVNRQVAAQRLASAQDLASNGVSPESGKSQAMQTMIDVGAAKAAGSADYTARKNVEQQGYARMADAANLGRNLSSTQATQQQISTNAGNSSVSASSSALGATQVGASQLASGYQTSINSANQSVNNYMSMAKLFNSSTADASNGVAAGMKYYAMYGG